MKLTVGFAFAMAALLAVTGILLLGQIDQQLDRSIEADLRLRARDTAELVAETQRAGDPLTIGAGGRLIQVLDTRNRVVAASADQRGRSLLTRSELARALRRETLLRRRGDGAGLLLLARRAGPGHVTVVGASLEPRAAARDSLERVVLVAGPALLLLAVLAGYGVAYFALRPVEAMRRRAAVLSVADTAQRLPVPPSRDELAALGRTLNAMIGRLESALERERTLIADASHELRTPLAIAQAEIELALRPGVPAGDAVDALRSVGEEVERLVRLCDDLLVLARADRQELRLQRRRVTAAELLARAADRARVAHGDRVVVADDGGADAAVDADPLRIEQALANLVGNAFHYGATHVQLSSAIEDGAIALHVRDDGPGFPEDFLPRAFDRFARGGQVATAGGAGLGLAIVAAVARAHGGNAGARNRADGGADVWMVLPRA